jgi:4-amino-4-deoxy-L-arabinose transferase-like glycosyltransferase
MSKKQTLLLVLTLAIAVMFANIGGLDIYALDEAKNAEAARIMYVTGDYIVPHFNGELRTDKPPLHYYFMAAGYALFGENAFGARFFSSVTGVMTILLTFLFAFKHFGQRTALFSSLVLICSLHTALQFHMSVPDPYLIFFLTWAFFSFYDGYESNSKWKLFAFYFAIGCGLLIKGPIAMGLTGLTVVLFLLLKKDFKLSTILRLQPFTGVLLSLMVAFPWYYLVHQKTNGEWTDGFFFKHNFDRFSSAMEGHSGIFLLTFVYVFILGMLTYLPFVFQSVKKAWLNRKENDAVMYLISGLIVIVGFFAISSTKIPNYTTPVYPLLAVLVGLFVAKIDASWFNNKWNRLGLWIYAIFLIGFPVGIYFGISLDSSLSHLTHLAWYFLPLAVTGFYLVYQLVKRHYENRMLYIINASWLVTIVLFFHLIFPQVDAENPVRKTMPFIDTSSEIVAFKSFNSAFVFELKRVITNYRDAEAIKSQMRQHETGYVISRTEHQEELEQIEGLIYVTEARDTFENPTTLIMKWGN